ncbi:nucleolin 2 isoform X2 [Dendrobium catenatum]|uniref:nucleolin 2 isoform X2 n=1 Tax=Dendrobium catenatum TaxID=906689 RepID=UPI0009F1B3D5|nr:nucleolin 2 isoform X2 [Dendrobium catenatum]
MEVETKRTEEDTEAEIKRAMRARVKDFKEQADSLTLEGVRRALEKDLGMKTLSLDVHKRFIKQCLEECFYGGDDVDLCTTTGSASDPCSPRISKETPDEKDEPQQPKDRKSTSSDINDGVDEYPVEEEKPNQESMTAEDVKHDDQLSEDTIKKAIKKRGPYFRANLEKISVAKVRRLLEDDLNLEKNTLDAYKSFISDVLDEVLQSPESADVTNGTKKKLKKASKSKETGKVKREPKVASEDSGSSNLGNDTSEADEDTDTVKRPKKRPLKKSKSSMKPIKKQKTSSDENKPSVSRKREQEEMDSDKGAESDNEKSSENCGSHSSSDERPKKKQDKPTVQAYGKHVEHLKSVIKACGMGVPPAVYKRAKQAPESKRESFLIKELEDILAKEGLSTNPSDKEIKSVKRKKERARELEGIDMSNIVSTSRRRSTFNFIPIPKPKIEAGSEEDEKDEEDEDDQEGTDDDDNGSGESSEGSEEDVDADADEEADEESD